VLEVVGAVPSTVPEPRAELDGAMQVAQVVQHGRPLGARRLAQDVRLKVRE